MRERCRELVLALSAANLFFLMAWKRLIFASATDKFLMRTHTATDFLAVVLNVLLLTVVLWSALRLARRVSGRFLGAALRSLPALTLIVPLSSAFGGKRLLDQLGHTWLTALYVVFAGLGVFVLVRWRSVAEALILILAPLAPMTVSQAVWRMFTAPPLTAPVSAPRQPVTASHPSRRVLWLVFDEMDERLAFQERAPGLNLTELDRLKGQSLYASHADSVALETRLSMPSLVSGRRVVASQALGSTDLWLTLEGEKQAVLWSATPTVFTAARDLGFRTALVGWYLPYCRVLAHTVTRCFWQARGDPEHSTRQTVAGTMRSQFEGLLPLLKRREHRIEYETLLEQAQRAAADPGLDLVFVHLPVPHSPPIYDRHRGDFSLLTYRKDWYLDNLVLADRTLGVLRRALEDAGLWDRTAIVVTSDHPWLLAHTYDGRKDARVPFIVKTVGSGESVHYADAMNTLVTHDLVLALLQHEMTSPAVADWLRTRNVAESGSERK